MRKTAVYAIGLVIAALVVWSIYTRSDGSSAPAGDANAGAVPVTAGQAEIRDMPVYVRGIGTVQAFNNVTIKSRVDGAIVKVDVTEGQEVKGGDLLFEIDPRPFAAVLAQATANKEKDQAQLGSAEADLQRDAALMAHEFQTRQAYDQQKALVGQIQASIKADRAQIDSAQLNLNYADIRSPIDGRTGARQVDVGNLVHAADNTGLMTVTQLRPIYVSFTAPQDELDAIRLSQGQKAITTEAYSDDERRLIASGALTLIDNQIDQATGTIHLKATFANDNEALWPGQFVNVRLVVGTMKNAVTVPARAIQRGPEGSYLFVVKPDMTVELRTVKVAETEQDVAAVASGLAAGETVVFDGQYRLEQGVRVKVQAPAGPGT